MKLIQRNNSRLLGQSRIKVDESILKEIGWGSHTFSLGVCTYEALDIFNFECAAYISESSLYIVTVDVTNRNREDKYEVPLSKVKDIELVRNNNAEESLFNDEEKDSLRQRVVIFLRGDKRLYLDTYDSPHFGKYIYSAWESITINKCAGLKGKVRARADPVLAAHYHEEVIKCFKETKIDDWEEKRLIMDEISEEVRLDLELKHLIFRSREFLTLLFEAAFTALNMPTGFEKEIDTKERLLGGSERASMDNYSYTYANTTSNGEKDNTFNMLSPRENAGNAVERALYEVQKKIQVIMYHRLGFLRSAMQFLTDLFFCAESVASRSYIISEIGPLDSDTWLQLLVPDLFVQMAMNLKCVSVLQQIESIGDNPAAYGSAMESTDFESKVAEMEAEIAGENGEGESKLGLDTDKLRRLTIHQNSLSNVTNKMVTNLITLKRSMRDLQMIAAFELYRVNCQGKSRPDHVGMSRLDNRVYNAKAHMPLGDLWVRQEGYEECLEFLLVRCSNILDDMLLSEKERVTITEHTGSRAARTNNQNNDNTPYGIPSKAPTLPPSPKRMMRKGLPSNTTQVPFGDSPGVALGGSTVGTGGRGTGGRFSGRAARNQQQQQKNELLVSRASKRPVLNINTSWDESSLPNSLGQVKESPFIYSALETQEIVLYYMSSLLKALVMESSKCREVTGKDNRSLWPPIIVVLDIICPRGRTMTHGDNPEPLDKAASGKMTSEYASIPHSPRAIHQQSSGAMFMSLLQSCTGNNLRAQQKTQLREAEMDRHTAVVDEVLNKLKHEHHEDLQKDAKYRKAIVLPWKPLSTYGPIRVHIDDQVSNLVVMARRNVEECMNVLGLHGAKVVDTKGNTIKQSRRTSGVNIDLAGQGLGSPRGGRGKRSPRSETRGVPRGNKSTPAGDTDTPMDAEKGIADAKNSDKNDTTLTSLKLFPEADDTHEDAKGPAVKRGGRSPTSRARRGVRK